MARDSNASCCTGAARDKSTMKVPSKDPRKKDDNEKDEDLRRTSVLKQQLELYVERVQDSDPGLLKLSLDSMM